MTTPPERLPVRIAWIVALAVVYAVVGRLGLLAEPVAGFATLVWPPSGLALAALARRGRWLWPGVMIGAGVVNLSVGAPLPVALGIAVGNTLAAVVACEGLRRASFDPSVSRVRDVLALIVVGAALSTLVSATVGVASLHADGIVTAQAVPGAFRAWWLGDAMGDLVVAPLVLAWTARVPLERDVSRALEAIGVTLVTAAAGLAVFGGVLEHAREVRSMYVLFPPLVWAAVRFGQRGATAAVASVSAIAAIGTIAGHGPFTREGLSGLLELQSFMTVASAMLLFLGAAITERDRARIALLASLRTREDFLAIASHELRTPLATLVLLLGTLKLQLRQRFEEGDQLLALTRAERQTDRLTQLVNHLLDASRIERGTFRITPKAGDLSEIVQLAVEGVREQATRASCELRVSIGAPVPGRWDRLRVEQVATNLLENAVRYAPGAPIDVVLTSDETSATLEIRDHGEGVPAERLADLFRPYQRGGAKRERGGFGLGLSIAESVVEAHGGSIRAEPADGGGTRFLVSMPRGREALGVPPTAG